MANEQQTPGYEAESESGLSFVAFVLSLAHTTAGHLGDVPDPTSGQSSPPNIAAASQMIDILALLERKTRGNLTAEERQLLDQVLYELRLRFVEVRSAGGGVQSEAEAPRREETVVPPSGSRTPSGIIIP
jgi:hypothetical protein